MTESRFAFPEIDYAAHPYYAPFLAGIGETERQAVWARFAAVHAEVAAQQKACADFRLAHPHAETSRPAELETLDRDGILPLRLQASNLDAILEVTAPFEARLAEQRAGLEPERLAVAGASLKICGPKDPEQAVFEELLARYGVFELCRRHKGLPYRLKFVVLQHNAHSDQGLSLVCSYDDKVRSPSFYAHIDSTVEAMKVIIYLTRDVTAARGAFRYFPGSHLASGPEDLAIRKSNDRCGWEPVFEPANRRAFAALPAAFRRKANFGNDLLDPEAAGAVLSWERVLDSSGGDLLLFNTDGVHRGAMFDEPGERKILQLSLTPDLRA